ncbi:winged helix-turn-helix domain-containing protein [Saccharopolyspora pogona]|uniref:winged helix-turn-helix domain-containing protein n=1 Tax=Saccharopolyspora pogona TaxID=333966 RepID=UPI001CC2322C
MRDRLGWSAQRPARRARERDEDGIATWIAEDWPRIKKTPPHAERGFLLRRVRAVADTDRAPQLGIHRANPGAGTPIQLETRLYGRRAVLPTQP